MIYSIYVIKCNSTEYHYVGISNNFDRRTKRHIYLLKLGIHNNKRMQNDFNKFGRKDFSVSLVELVECSSITQAMEYERKTILKYENVYNINNKEAPKILTNKIAKQIARLEMEIDLMERYKKI